MSNELITRIYRTKLGDPVMKAILIALADQASNEGFCWPSIETIANRTEYGERTIQKKLADAEKRRLIKRRFRADRSTQYLFNIELLPLSENETKRPKETGPWEEMFAAKGTGAGDSPDLFGPPSDVHPTPAGDSPHPRPTCTHNPNRTINEPSLTLVANATAEETLEDFTVRRWNEIAAQNPTMAKTRPLEAGHRQKIRNRAMGARKPGETEWAVINEFFAAIERSDFLKGKAPPGPGRTKGFRPSLIWMLKPENFAKVVNGAYDDQYDRDGRNIEGTRNIGPTATAIGRARARFSTGSSEQH